MIDQKLEDMLSSNIKISVVENQYEEKKAHSFSHMTYAVPSPSWTSSVYATQSKSRKKKNTATTTASTNDSIVNYTIDTETSEGL